MMKIALLTNGIWPYVIGGMQKHSFFLCKYFAGQKIHVVLVHSAPKATEHVKELDCFSSEEKQYIQSVYVETPGVKPFPGHYIYQSYLYSKRVYAAIKDMKDVDFVIAKGMAGWYTLSKKYRAAPVAVNIHGYEFLQKKASFKMKIEALMLRFPLTYVSRKADYVFSYGGKISTYIRSLGVVPKKIIEVPGAIEADWVVKEPGSLPATRTFVFMGRWERRKGIEELNQAIVALKKGTAGFNFHFVGPVPEANKVKEEGVFYHGVLRDKESIQTVLQLSHVLVCPSYAEGMPNVILEGMANGCAVIATDAGATSLLVNDQVGWLIPVANASALQSALENALSVSDEEMLEKRKASVEKIRRSFTWDQVGKDIFVAIQKIIR